MNDQMMDEITTLLDGYHVDTLVIMAREAGIVATGKGRPRKAELQAVMRAQFFTRERVLASLERLGRRERRLLDRLLLYGGTAPTKSLRREVVKAGSVTDGNASEEAPSYHYSNVAYATGVYVGNPHREASHAFEDVVARLTLRGLVFSRIGGWANSTPMPKVQFHPADTLYIPAAVRAHLPEPEPVLAPATPEPQRVVQGEPAFLLRDLYLYWDYARRNAVPLTKSGLVAKRALRAINEHLLVPDPRLGGARSEVETGRLALLRQLLQALGLLRGGPTHLSTAGEPCEGSESSQGSPGAFWSRPEVEQIAVCLRAWPGLMLQELGSDAEAYEPQPAQARQAVLQALLAQPAGAWAEPEALLDGIQAGDEDFMFPEHSRIASARGSWYYGYGNGRYYGSPKALLQMLERLEAKFVGACLTGLPHLLGLVELGYVEERLATARLTALGRALVAGEPAGELGPQATGQVIIQPSFELLALGPVSLGVLAQLDLFADRQRADVGAFAYQLSRESVYRAQQGGLEVASIVRFLEQTSAVALPQNVRRSLEEWGAHHERIVLRSGVSLLQAATPELLATLLAQPETAPLLARAVSPDVALVAAGSQGRLTAALVAQGLFPAVSGAEPQSADRSVIAEGGTALRPIHAVPSLHLRTRLARLAEEDGDGRWHLTANSVRRAGGNRTRVQRLLEELGRLHRGALPEELVEQVKAWGSYYGDAAVQSLTLIEFGDPASLDELRADPALQGQLTPFPAGERALAIVAEGRLADVRRLLAERGVQG
ncbi:MAG TPA: helicase-associated domain-containing protein, partial [Anaerolineae bacterium]|nr:helicase-associated domain-containing protein [Anaerolineae bacterium]